MIELIDERGFEALTIGEITERAMVSRAAFYRNYQDKRDLVEQIFQEAMNELLNTVGAIGQQHPPEIWVRFFKHIADYERLYRALLGSKGSPWFARKMRASLVDLIAERGRLPHGPEASSRPAHSFSDEFVPYLVSTMFVEAITWWLEQGMPYTPTEIATRSGLLAAAMFREASAWQ
ncbi:MAG TPA: TetR/AcrR family transcriptional regulator [Ktedonobacterales bacterium]